MDLKRSLERLVTTAAKTVWPAVKQYNARFERPSPRPGWAPAPLLKRRERSFPQLGWPRTTDSLCPRCVKEVRTAIFDGTRSISDLADGKPGEIPAQILEEDGQIVMKKTCQKHGTFTDLMSVDPAWLRRIERLYPGRDFKAPPTPLRQHGSSSIQYGRGSVLTVDLTNRCNMMCDACFMDANRADVGGDLNLFTCANLLRQTGHPAHLRLVLHPRMVHAKAVVGDGTWVDLGSTNFTQLSHGGYEELNVFSRDPAFAQEVEQAILREAGAGTAARLPLDYRRWRLGWELVITRIQTDLSRIRPRAAPVPRRPGRRRGFTGSAT